MLGYGAANIGAAHCRLTVTGGALGRRRQPNAVAVSSAVAFIVPAMVVRLLTILFLVGVSPWISGGDPRRRS